MIRVKQLARQERNVTVSIIFLAHEEAMQIDIRTSLLIEGVSAYQYAPDLWTVVVELPDLSGRDTRVIGSGKTREEAAAQAISHLVALAFRSTAIASRLRELQTDG